MADPLTLASVGSLVLTEGVKFLFKEAGELLKRWRGARAATSDEASRRVQTLVLVLPPALGGDTLSADVDLARVEPVAERILQLRGVLSNYADGTSEVDPQDRALLGATEDLRGLLEDLLGRRLTLTGEERPASGAPIVRSTLQLGVVEGEATGVDVDSAASGVIESDASAQEVKKGGRMTGVRIGTLGQPPQGD